MKKFLLSVLAATTMFAACTTESTTDVVSVPVPDVLTVSLEEDTRMQLMNEKTVWNEGDLVSVFYKSNANQKWQFNGVTGDRYGELTRVEAGVASAEMEKVVVVYPYDANYLVTPSTGAIEATLPAEQSYLEGSYGLGSSMMISSGYYRQFTLKNVMGWLKLQLTGDGEKVTKVVFRGNNGEQVAGNVYVEADDATLILSSTEAEAGEAAGGTLSFENSVVTELTLNCDGVALGAEATSFYLALPPQEFTNGFTVEIWGQDANGNELKMVKKSEAALTIERNVIQPLEAVAYEGKPTSLTAAFSAVDSTMFPAMHGMPGIYLINVSNEAGDLGQLLFYDNTTPFVALNGEYPVVVGSLGQELEGPCFLADPGYCNFFMGGVNYYPVSGTVNVFSTLAQGSPEDNNAFEFNLVVMDDAGNELPLIGALESNIVGALGYGPSYIDFNLAEWGFNTFEVSYDENSANIVKLTSTTTSGDFVMELSTENGDITEGAYNALSGTLSGYYFDGLDAKEYVFKDGQIIFEKVEGTENSYNLVISSRAGDWVLGDKYKVVIPEEGYYTVTINFPAPEEPEVSEPSVNLALIGSFTDWAAELPMEYSNGIYFVKGFDLDAYATFKIKTVGTWDVNVGASTVNYLNPGNHIAVVNDSNSGDIAITEAGTYDIYFDLANLKLYVVAADADYTSAPLQTENGPEPPVVEPEVTENVLYLKPNSNWNQDNARFAAYFFNASGNTWVSATDSDADGIYEVYIPTGYVAGENVIFCRMNPSTTANDWNNKWNQTGDLVIPTDDKNLYTVADGAWDNGNGTWSVK